MSPLVVTIICMLVSFAVCGIPFGLFIARAHGVDVRKEGSGNIGMTNVARTVGGGAAAATLLLDLFKGTACVLLSRLVLAKLCCAGDWAQTVPQQALGWSPAWVYLSCVFGHVFSPYLGFHGGKGIAVGLGSGLGLSWPIGLGPLAVFFAAALPTGYVSLGSILAAASVPVWAVVLGFNRYAIVPLVIVAAVVIWSHRENIGRLLSGTERKFSLHKS